MGAEAVKKSRKNLDNLEGGPKKMVAMEASIQKATRRVGSPLVKGELCCPYCKSCVYSYNARDVLVNLA